MTSGEKIIGVELRDEMRKSFIDYAMSVIVSRAIPDVRDGLKPVHRRIIYGMDQLNLTPNRPFRKAAKTVGDVMGNYHPHGDSAIYEALVRLAQPQASRYPMVDGHGNFGDLDNPPAAMRYTEARLTPMAMETLADLKYNTYETRFNFDETLEEPAVLPSRLPLLLLNGSSGIAVGMATNIPPHNLREVVDGAIAKIDNPSLDSLALMKYIKGPDFPGGGQIVGTDGIRDAYTTGRGSIICRGDVSIETVSGSGKQTRNAIIITSLPYMVGPEAFTKRVADLVRDDGGKSGTSKISGISNVNDETDRSGLRVVIELKRDAHPEIVLNNLYKHTQLQQSFPVNTLGLVLAEINPKQELGVPTEKKKKPEARKCTPKTLTIADILDNFIAHRVEVVDARTRHMRVEAETRAHILAGYLIALNNLDEVIKLIRASDSRQDAHEGLIKKFKLTEIQADKILEMQLSRLTKLQRKEIEDEHTDLLNKIADFTDILDSHAKALISGDRASDRILQIIKEELSEIKKKHGDDRRSKIISASNDTSISDKDLVPNEKMLIFITKQDYIKRVPLDTFKRQRRNTRGVSGVKTKDEDDLQHCLEANTHDKLFVFTNKGLVYSIDVMDIPESSRAATGRAILNLVSMSQDDSVTAVIPVSEEDLASAAAEASSLDETTTDSADDENTEGRSFNSGPCFVMLTAQGLIKKVPLSEFANIRKSGIKAITFGDQGETKDQLSWVRRSNGKSDIIVGTSDGMTIRYEEAKVRPMGRTARGVKAINLKEGDNIVGFDVVEATEDSYLLFVTTDGYGKRSKLEEFRAQGRGGVGIIGIKFKNASSRLACLRVVCPKTEVLIATQGGIVVRQRADDIPSQGRMATGVRLQQVGDDQVASVTLVEEPTTETGTSENPQDNSAS